MNDSMKVRVAARITIEIIAGIAEKLPDVRGYFLGREDTDKAILVTAEGKDRGIISEMLKDRGIPFSDVNGQETIAESDKEMVRILVPISYEKELKELFLSKSDAREELEEEEELEVKHMSENDADVTSESKDTPAGEEDDTEEDELSEEILPEPKHKRRSDKAKRRHIFVMPDSEVAAKAKQSTIRCIHADSEKLENGVVSQVISIGTAEGLDTYSEELYQIGNAEKIAVPSDTFLGSDSYPEKIVGLKCDELDTKAVCRGKEYRGIESPSDREYRQRKAICIENEINNDFDSKFGIPIYKDKGLYVPERNETRSFVNKETIEAWRKKRFYEVKTEASSEHFKRASRNIEMIAGEVIAPRDTAGGKGMHQVLNVARPVATYLHAKYIQHGIMSFNQEIRFDEEIYTAAYATVKGIKREGGIRLNREGLPFYPIEHARVDVKQFMKNMPDVGTARNIDMAKFNKYVQSSNARSFAEMIRGLSKSQLQAFAKAAGLSEEMLCCISRLPEYTEFDSRIFKQLSLAASDSKDKAFVEMFRGSNLFDRMGTAPARMAIKTLSRRLMYKTIGDSPGSGGISTVTSLGRNIGTVYKTGLKGTERIAKRLGAQERTLDVIRYARSPIRHTYKTVIKGTSAGNKIHGMNTKITSKILKMQERIASKMTSKISMEAGKVAAEKAAVTAAAEGTAAGTGAAGASAAGTGASGASAGAAAGGIGAGGIVAIIVIAIIVIIAVIAKIQNDHANEERVSLMRTGNWAENTEIVDELINEFEAMNTEFNRQINDARYHRGNFSMNTSYKGGQTATEYESYHVIFRDGYGNELDPKTVDFNNTKAIIAMASTYFPYPFPNHTQGDDRSKEYEEIKQYFKDYCYFLWASTHRISIEEYYPGDADYEEYGDNSFATYQGKCDADGQTVWLPEDLSPNIIYMNETSEEEECSLCTPNFATNHGLISKALCTHPYETYVETDGWRKTGNVRSHIHCPGHRVTDYGTDENGNRVVDGYHYEYCEEGSIRSKAHVHASYEWEYVCGGHMSAVVYVTIGDVSRISSMPAAGDIDYGTVGTYKEE